MVAVNGNAEVSPRSSVVGDDGLLFDPFVDDNAVAKLWSIFDSCARTCEKALDGEWNCGVAVDGERTCETAIDGEWSFERAIDGD